MPLYKQLVIEDSCLISEWDNEENSKHGLFPDKLSCGSRSIAFWKCPLGHHYPARIAHRKAGHGCPYCSGRKAIPGETDFETLYPQIALEWDYESNSPLTPRDVKPKSNISVNWKCARGHIFPSVIAKRVEGTGCPYCANQKVLKGYNDLETLAPNLAKEWDYRNNKKLPSEVLLGSNKRYYWLCPKGHSYLAAVGDRNRGGSCPYCANRKVLVGYNDLNTQFPEVAADWNYEKNGEKTPDKVVYGSTEKVWWKCKKGHEWKASIVSRTKDGYGCSICSSAKSTSFPEKAVLFYVRKSFPEAQSNYKSQRIKNRELDVYLPKQNIGIEYDGDIWHRDAARDIEKNCLCKLSGITLIRIREPECPLLDGQSLDYLMKNHSSEEYNAGIVFVLKTLSSITKKEMSFDVDVSRDVADIMELKEIEEVERSLASVNPALAQEWHPTKNKRLQPSQIAANSQVKVWWKGVCGHEWPAVVASRNNGQCGCPICCGLCVLEGFNDLQTAFPQISAEWSYEKNNGLRPSEITSKSSKKVWWKCPKGHEYPATVVARTTRGDNCPYCSNHRALPGYNDLQTTHPQLALEWNYEKNGNLSPSNVTAYSGKKVWWRCPKGHEYPSIIANRTAKGSNCPYCSNRKVLPGYNDLKTTHPQLAEEWLYEKNGELKPTDVTAGSGKKVWWKCKKCGKEWKAYVLNRSRGAGCKCCIRSCD